MTATATTPSTARAAAESRSVVPGLNAFGRHVWAKRVADALNAEGQGEFVVEYAGVTGARNFGCDNAMCVVVLAGAQ